MSSAPAFAGALALTCSLAIATAAWGVTPSDSDPVAVLGSATDQAGRILAIAGAGGAVLAAVGDHVTVALPDGPDFVSRLRRQGYWLVLDARAVPGCSVATAKIRGNHVQ